MTKAVGMVFAVGSRKIFGVIMTYIIFALVVIILFGLARLTKLTYNTINILVYYLLIPLSWAYMGDKIIGWQIPWLSVGWSTIWLVIFIIIQRRFSKWCDWVFRRSVIFLRWFKCLKWNYYVASVYICVWLPLIIYGVLAYLLTLQHSNWIWQPWAIGISSIFFAVWILWVIIMKYGVKLIPLKVFALVSYPLTTEEERQVINDTRGMNHNQVISYALDVVKRQFSYHIYPSEESEASCVGFSSMFTSVVNLGFKVNGISAIAVTVEGTAKVCGIDICKELGRRISPMLGMHKFTLIRTSNGSAYCIDPTIKAIFGYCLKTII